MDNLEIETKELVEATLIIGVARGEGASNSSHDDKKNKIAGSIDRMTKRYMDITKQTSIDFLKFVSKNNYEEFERENAAGEEVQMWQENHPRVKYPSYTSEQLFNIYLQSLKEKDIVHDIHVNIKMDEIHDKNRKELWRVVFKNFEDQMDQIVERGLGRKGYEFKDREGMANFAMANCRIERMDDLKQEVFYVKDTAFLVYCYGSDRIEFSMDMEHVSAYFGTYSFL